MEAALLSVLILLLLVLTAGVFWLIVLVGRARTGDATDPTLLQRLQHVAQTESSLLHGLQNVSLQVNELQAYARARHDLERQTTMSIKRLEAIIAGTQSKGAAGENIVEFAFSKLPAAWQVRNFTVGNRRGGFGLRLAGQI